MERDAMLTFRMPRATRRALELAAAAERRSMSDLAVIIISDWLAARGHISRRRAPKGKR